MGKVDNTRNKVENCYYLEGVATSDGVSSGTSAFTVEQMTDVEGWESTYAGFNGDDGDNVWSKQPNGGGALYLPHLAALVGQDVTAPYNNSLDHELSYPFIPGNPLTVTLGDKAYDGQAIDGLTYSADDGTECPQTGVKISYRGTTNASGNPTYGPTEDAPASAGTYTVTVSYSVTNADETTTYYAGSIDFEIERATPVADPAVSCVPVDESGKTLNDCTLSGKFDVDGSLSWSADASTEITAGASYEWTFTPTDSANYETVKGSLVPWPVPVTGVTVEPSKLTLGVGGSSDLTATIAPSDATNQDVTWSSGNPDVATVDGDGTVTAVACGTANITVTTKDGKKTAQCVVTVIKNNQEALSITGVPGAVYVGDTFTLGTAGGTGDGTVAWTVVSGPATIDKDTGEVQVTGAGTITIQAVKAGGDSYEDATAEFSFSATNRPSSGGGSGVVTRYPVDVEDTEHGSVAVSPITPSRGQTVTITPEPDNGYEVSGIAVADKDGGSVDVIDNGNGTWSFEQPVGSVSSSRRAPALVPRWPRS